MTLLNYRPTKQGLSVYRLVGKSVDRETRATKKARWQLVRRIKATTIEALNDLPEDALDLLWQQFGIRPPEGLGR